MLMPKMTAPVDLSKPVLIPIPPPLEGDSARDRWIVRQQDISTNDVNLLSDAATTISEMKRERPAEHEYLAGSEASATSFFFYSGDLPNRIPKKMGRGGSEKGSGSADTAR